MLLANILKNVCGCKVVEGQSCSATTPPSDGSPSEYTDDDLAGLVCAYNDNEDWLTEVFGSQDPEARQENINMINTLCNDVCDPNSTDPDLNQPHCSQACCLKVRSTAPNGFVQGHTNPDGTNKTTCIEDAPATTPKSSQRIMIKVPGRGLVTGKYETLRQSINDKIARLQNRERLSVDARNREIGEAINELGLRTNMLSASDSYIPWDDSTVGPADEVSTVREACDVLRVSGSDWLDYCIPDNTAATTPCEYNSSGEPSNRQCLSCNWKRLSVDNCPANLGTQANEPIYNSEGVPHPIFP